jgi:hypothetical protein
MTVRELIERLQTAPPDSQLMIKNTDGTFRPATLAGFHYEDGTETELIVSQPQGKDAKGTRDAKGTPPASAPAG